MDMRVIRLTALEHANFLEPYSGSESQNKSFINESKRGLDDLTDATPPTDANRN